MTARGFSLIELLVVLVLIALVFAVVPFTTPRALEQAELEGAARSLALTLREARGRAVSTQREVAVVIDLSRRQYGIENSGSSAGLPGTAAVAFVTAREELQGAGVAAVRFYPDGGASGGRVTLTALQRSYAVDIDWLTGRVRVFD